MAEDIEGVLRACAEIERLARPPIANRDRQVAGFAVPEERDGDAVALALGQFGFHGRSVIDVGLARQGTTIRLVVRLAAPEEAVKLALCERTDSWLNLSAVLAYRGEAGLRSRRHGGSHNFGAERLSRISTALVCS